MTRLLCFLLVCHCLATPARGDFHFWLIEEIFSTADGSVQYIELHTDVAGQHVLGNHVLRTNSGDPFVFPTNLPSPNTAGRSFILGTVAFMALPGAVQPDYVIPSNFFSIDGDTIVLEGAFQFTFSDAELPLDGRTALKRDKTHAINLPTNFANQTGSVTISDVPPWQNPLLPLDVDDNGSVQPLDVLVLINAINAGINTLPDPPSHLLMPPPYYDPDGNGSLQPLDVLIVINFINAQPITLQLLAPMALRAEPATLAAAVPEPSTFILGAAGIVFLFGRANRRSRRFFAPAI